MEVEYNLALVAVIGNAMNQTSGISGQLFSTLEDYNIRLVCHGASANNVFFGPRIRSTSGGTNPTSKFYWIEWKHLRLLEAEKQVVMWSKH